MSHNSTQDWRWPSTYFTEKLWNVIKDPLTDYNVKISSIIQEVHNFGLISPSEKSYRYLQVPMLLAHFNGNARPADKLKLKRDLKSERELRYSVGSHSKHDVWDFPQNPMDLTERVRARAWPAGRPQPITVDIDDLDFVAKNTIVRGTHASLKTATTRIVPHVPAPAPAQDSTNVALINMVSALVSQLQQQPLALTDGRDHTIDLPDGRAGTVGFRLPPRTPAAERGIFGSHTPPPPNARGQTSDIRSPTGNDSHCRCKAAVACDV
jgi:hypothetical protein